ncbi:ExbD/TolR family protein [Aurantiacibacter flavus]|uniref:Biopolymer transporter ExbD n=1 Tax=Aurantiacibacter flavus TaxID=3145232 RepID=A0ABV0CXS5_9SPHN
MSRANSLPILLFLSTLVMVGLTFERVPIHVLTFDLPLADPAYGLPRPPEEKTHLLSPTRFGSIEWDGKSITTSELIRHLQDGMRQPIEPRIVFAPDGNASYELAVRVLKIIKDSGVTKLCFGELERYREFAKDSQQYRLNLTLIAPEVSIEWDKADLRPPQQALPRCS